MQLTAYEIESGAADGWVIRPASRERDWMSANNSHAYRCLPLVVANQMGWVVECPVNFTAIWDGRDQASAIQFQFEQAGDTWASQIENDFGNGIITFRLPWLFKTGDEVGLVVRGQTNHWKINAHALDGFVETWWLPFTFTMNWKIIQPNIPVQFAKGEPICLIHPFDTRLISNTNPDIRDIETDAPLQQEYTKWKFVRRMVNHLIVESRDKTVVERDGADDENNVSVSKFNSKYMKGQNYSDQRTQNHQKQIAVRSFKDKRSG